MTDFIYGGGGMDLIVGDGGNFDFVNDEVPTSSPTIDIEAISIRGTGGSDFLFGEAGDDAIFGSLGDDTICMG